MDDRMRVSDADREAVTARLRDHYAEGRLTSTELDERVSAALSAKTAGELRVLTRDLPGPAPVPPNAVTQPPWPGPRWAGRRRAGPRWAHRRPPVLLFALLALLVFAASPGGGWLLFGAVRLMLVFWLVTILARIAAAVMYRRSHHYR